MKEKSFEDELPNPFGESSSTDRLFCVWGVTTSSVGHRYFFPLADKAEV